MAVDAAEVVLRRSQMGRSVRSFFVAGPRPSNDQGDGYWIVLSGAPSPDANMALVDSTDPAVLATALDYVEAAAVPAILMLAGEARSQGMRDGWQHVGSMPFMELALDSAHLIRDARVRQAGAKDFETVSGLLADAYGMEREIADVMAVLVRVDLDDAWIWLLEDGGDAVSTVVTSRIDDTVCVWGMATPERFGRRGFGRALLGEVLGRARDDGAAIGLLGATPAGKPLYEATGWSTIEEWELYLNAESAQFGH
jgi:GNAT superfamily N-acetyltransferase